MDICIVTTTINDPPNKGLLAKSLQASGFTGKIVVTADRKTPPISLDGYSDVLDVLTIEDQYKYLKNPLGIPLDSIQRRNIGYLWAIKEYDPSFIITVDDDNFPLDDDWVSKHVAKMGLQPGKVLKNKSNVLSLLLEAHCTKGRCFPSHRGMSFEDLEEYQKNEPVLEDGIKTVGVNAGMWVGDPDVDAYSRIIYPNLYTSEKDDALPSVMVDPYYLFHPFNSQNTCIINDLFYSLFLVPMGSLVYDYRIGRYDDIWQSYICQKVMSNLDLSIRFGTPIVKQDRNVHSNVGDLHQEYPGILLTNKFIKLLTEDLKLFSSSSKDNMYEVSDALLKSEVKYFNEVGQKILWWLGELK